MEWPAAPRVAAELAASAASAGLAVEPEQTAVAEPTAAVPILMAEPVVVAARVEVARLLRDVTVATAAADATERGQQSSPTELEAEQLLELASKVLLPPQASAVRIAVDAAVVDDDCDDGPTAEPIAPFPIRLRQVPVLRPHFPQVEVAHFLP